MQHTLDIKCYRSGPNLAGPAVQTMLDITALTCAGPQKCASVNIVIIVCIINSYIYKI